MASAVQIERKSLYAIRNPARGVKRGSGVEVCIRFDPGMMTALRARAQREGRAFAEVVRTYCQWGIDADREKA